MVASSRIWMLLDGEQIRLLFKICSARSQLGLSGGWFGTIHVPPHWPDDTPHTVDRCV